MSVEDVRWVVTVPAIWRQQAKQFMREAAYQVGRILIKLILSIEFYSLYGSKTQISQSIC